MASTSTWDTPRVHPGATPESSRKVIRASLQAVRHHLGMEVAFVGRFDHGLRIFEFVDSGEAFCPIDQGDSDPREDTYCDLVANGRIPELIPDTAEVPAALALPVTRELPVGSHISVPLHSASGETVGTFCCFSRQADPTLRRRDLDVLKVVGEVVGEHLHFLLGHREAHDEAHSWVTDVLVRHAPSRLILEITEHERLVLDDTTRERLALLRSCGVRVAVDDAGSGYAGLEHILQVAPDVLKLDRVLVQGIAADPARQAMCDAMVRFTARTGATLVAEGVESDADLETLRSLGVRYAQGYLLGRPEVWPDA